MRRCALFLGGGGDAFSYASPLYVFFLAVFYLAGVSDSFVFAVQSIIGIATAVLIFRITERTIGNSKHLIPALAAAVWLLYAPAAFYETTLLPVSLLSLMICLWYLLESGKKENKASPFLSGFLSGLITGLRPTFIFLGLFTLIRFLRKKLFAKAAFSAIGMVLPLLFLSMYHVHQGGAFSPFAASSGVNLALGHADGATGYGPPVSELGLMETPGSDIHQVAAAVAADSGYSTPEQANSFWTRKAVDWIRNNPGAEIELIGVKLGAVFGYRPFDTYYDLERDIQSDGSMGILPVPRWIVVFLLVSGGISLIALNKNQNIHILLPMVLVIAAAITFVHSERYWLPALPLALAGAVSGIYKLVTCFSQTSLSRKLILVSAIVLLMLPGLFWPVPQIPKNMYLYNRGIKALNIGNSVLALSLFESAAQESPRDCLTTTEVYSRMWAVRIAESMGMQERALEHANALRDLMEDS